nr:hypothetical protein [Tanacetum cinerariifolium]
LSMLRISEAAPPPVVAMSGPTYADYTSCYWGAKLGSSG